MKRLILLLLSFIMIFIQFCQAAQRDDQAILKIMTEILQSYETNDRERISGTLGKYINPAIYRRTFGGNGLNRNTFELDGKTIYGKGLVLTHYRFKLDDYSIWIDQNTAAVFGNVKGGEVLSDNKFPNQRWQIYSCWYKNGNQWYLEYLNLYKYGVSKLQYYPQLPTGYEKYPLRKWPLILFLHGVGERGGTLESLRMMNHSIPYQASHTKNFPFVTVSPLCPAGYTWSNLSYSIDDLLNEVIPKYQVDPDRIYLTGLSMGGIGTWTLAMRFPDRFAAIAPVCGNVMYPERLERLKHLPIWAFHGARDPVISMFEEKQAVETLKKMGGNIRYTIYPEVGHEAWVKAYTTQELYTWFLKHRRLNK